MTKEDGESSVKKKPGNLNKEGVLMKRLFGVLTLLSICGICLNAAALPLPNLATATYPLRGESDLFREGRDSYVDWIVSTTDLATSIPDGQFVFATNFNTAAPHGDITAYRNSMYYYYYQVENTSGNFGTSFSLKLEPSTVVTIGYMLDVDLDDGLDITHLDTDTGLAGENDNGSSPIVDFGSASFDPNPPQPNGSFNFAGGLASGSESTVFFVTCVQPPEYFIAELLTGPQGPEGLVPIPLNPIPEPMTMFLFSSALGVLAYLRRRK